MGQPPSPGTQLHSALGPVSTVAQSSSTEGSCTRWASRSSSVTCGPETISEPQLLVFRAGQRAVLRANSDAPVMLLGGHPLEGPRHIWWNFVSSSPERIERAKRDRAERRFPLVPGDEEEFILLPER